MSFDGSDNRPFFPQENRYDFNNKIMLTAIISLSVVVVIVTVLHLYARFVLRRQARRRAALRQLGLITSAHVHSSNPTQLGLDPEVIAALPLFVFGRTEEENEKVECAVCLSILEVGDTARVLPNCKHKFHAECIDKWLSSHSTCPICRTEAQPRPMPEPREGFVDAAVPTGLALEAGSTSDDRAHSSMKVSESISRLNSFRRMLSGEWSSRRIQVQPSGQEGALEDLERQ